MPTPHYLQSTRLREAGFRHAFFSRVGGVSTGAYRSLNFSFAVGDAPERVQRNFDLAAEALEVPSRKIIFLSQVHGRGVRRLQGAEVQDTSLFDEGDALVSASSEVACAVRTADCLPILIGDPASGAVAAIHAGWRGLVANVIGAAVAALAETARARPEGFIAAIGPHISQAAFEVSPEVAAELAAASAAKDALDERAGRRPHVRLSSIARAQLANAGLRTTEIEDVGGCTVGDPELYFSYRRDGKASGRHLHAIVARPPQR